MVNQLEMSPFLYQTRAAARAACDRHGVVLEAYSPLTKGHRGTIASSQSGKER